MSVKKIARDTGNNVLTNILSMALMAIVSIGSCDEIYHPANAEGRADKEEIATVADPDLWYFLYKKRYRPDGDSFHLINSEGVDIHVRIPGIQCPELKIDELDENGNPKLNEKGKTIKVDNPAGFAARDFTLAWLNRGPVTLSLVPNEDIDKHGRTLRLVNRGDESLAEELIKAGHAVVYKKYCNYRPLCRKWRKLQRQAARR